jgi:hypothetical protein
MYFKETRRRWPLQRKSVITPPASKVISRPETFEIDCVINHIDEVKLGTLCDFLNERFGTSFNWKAYVYIEGLRDNWDNFVKVLEPYIDKPSFKKHPIGNYVTFSFKEKQETPGFRKMKISKKSRFYKENS